MAISDEPAPAPGDAMNMGALSALLADGNDGFTVLGEHLREPVFCKDVDDRFVYANAATLSVLGGIDAASVVGRKLSELCPGAAAERIERNDRTILSTGQTAVVEEPLDANGAQHIYLSTKTALRDRQGQVSGLVCIAVDITELAVRQGRTRARVLRLRRGLQAAGEKVYAWNPATGRFSASAHLHELIGSRARIRDIDSWREHIHPDDRALHEQWCAELQRLEDGTSDLEYRVRHAGDRWLWVWERAMVSRGPRGGARRVTSNIANISERKGMEERLHTALDAAQMGLWSTDAEGAELLASPRARAVLDFDPLEPMSLVAIARRIDPADRPRVLRTWLRMVRRECDPVAPLQFRIQLRNGRSRWIESATRLVLAEDSAGPRISAIVGTAADITPRQHAEAELRASAERFRQLVENLDDVFWIVDYRRQRLLYVSPTCERFWGYTQQQLYADPRLWSGRIHREDRDRVTSAFAAIEYGADYAIEYRILCGDGGVRWLRDRAVAVWDADGAVERVMGVAEDITQRRDHERSSRERERRLDIALGAAKFHIWTFDVRAHRLSLDDALCAALGLTANQCARPGGWRRRIHPDDRVKVERAFRECLAGGPDIDVEFRTQLKGGTPGWLALRATLFPDDDAGPQLYGVCSDVTARRADEERMRESELQLRTLNDSIPVGIARCSLDRRYVFVNRAYAQDVLALPAEDVEGRAIVELIGSEAEATREPHIARVLAGERVTLTTAIEFKGVGKRAVNMSLIPERDEQGKVSGWIELINDLTERARVEGRLYQRDREFKTLVENAPDIIARLDRNLRYLYINRAVEFALGMSPDAFVGRSGSELGLPPRMLAASETAATTAFETGEEQPASFEVGTDLGMRYFSARMIPEFDRAGETVESVMMVIYDITERASAQRERERLHAAERAARERAEAATRARDQFLAIVSHELRSPLNGIQNWSNVLESQLAAGAPDVMWRALAGIKSGVDQQVRLIEDLLDATRIMSGTLSLTPAIIEIRPVVEAAIASVSAAAAAKHIELLSSLYLAGERIRGDPDRIQQIIWNLLSNALKFTPAQGQVKVLLDRVGSTVRLRVTDDGKGIDADFLPHMFDWFRRDETSSHRGQDGLGLGLALVRHLCELHGGTVLATSPGPGLGASFEVRLPLLIESARAEGSGSADGSETRTRLPSLAGLRVIAIDDQRDALDALSTLLSGMQAQVQAFGSCASALHWMRTQGVYRCADVVLCDIAMPIEDGYLTLAQIRTLERESAVPIAEQLRVVALTAYAQREERQRALDAGFALHLAKPVSAAALAAAVTSLARSWPER